MSPHEAHLHAIHYWIEIALVPFVLWALYLVARYAWQRGWMPDDWYDGAPYSWQPPTDDDLTAVQHPDVEPGEPAPWRR